MDTLRASILTGPTIAAILTVSALLRLSLARLRRPARVLQRTRTR